MHLPRPSSSLLPFPPLFLLFSLVLSAPALLQSRCTNPEFSAFFIQNLQVFTSPNASSISFTYYNPESNVETSCGCTLEGDGIMAAEISVANSESWTQCEEPVVSYNWDGITVTILHGWFCNLDGVAGGHVKPETFCFSVEPPYPLGAGTLCETPTGWVLGVLTNNWEENGTMTGQVDGDGNPV